MKTPYQICRGRTLHNGGRTREQFQLRGPGCYEHSIRMNVFVRWIRRSGIVGLFLWTTCSLLAIEPPGIFAGWGITNLVTTNSPAIVGPITQISAGGFHALALRTNQTVAAWGEGLNGQTNVPPDLTNAIAVSAGAQHSLALRSDG